MSEKDEVVVLTCAECGKQTAYRLRDGWPADWISERGYEKEQRAYCGHYCHIARRPERQREVRI